MNGEPDPFIHHPELRDLISDPLTSFFRTFSIEALATKSKELGLKTQWWHSDEDREAMRRQSLAGRQDGDLWVFAYGSLMWDPAIRFAEVRHARVPDYARRFILKDIFGGRGTSRAPGLMAALDKGPGCDGLAFQIRGELVEPETQILWRREQIGPAYTAAFVTAVTAQNPITTLTFVADHDARLIDPNLTREEQIHYLATGTGFMGSSLDYLRNIATKFAALGIHDEEVDYLLREAEAYAKAM